MLKYATFEGVFFIKNFKKERKIQVEKGNISSRKKQKYSNKKNLKYSNSKRNIFQIFQTFQITMF